MASLLPPGRLEHKQFPAAQQLQQYKGDAAATGNNGSGSSGLMMRAANSRRRCVSLAFSLFSTRSYFVVVLRYGWLSIVVRSELVLIQTGCSSAVWHACCIGTIISYCCTAVSYHKRLLCYSRCAFSRLRSWPTEPCDPCRGKDNFVCLYFYGLPLLLFSQLLIVARRPVVVLMSSCDRATQTRDTRVVDILSLRYEAQHHKKWEEQGPAMTGALLITSRYVAPPVVCIGDRMRPCSFCALCIAAQEDNSALIPLRVCYQ